MADPPDPITPRSSPELDVPTVPVAPPGRRRGAPLVGAIALVAVVVAGVALAQAFPADPVTPVVQRPSIAAVSPTPGPSATPPLAQAPRLRAAELVAGVLDGSLDGALVYADATLEVSCQPEGASECQVAELAIDGLGLDVVADLATSGWARPVPAGAVLVLRVRGRRLEYLGSLLTHAGGAPSIATLDDEVAAAPPDERAPTLRDAGGWLIVNPSCFAAVSLAPPCDTPPFLAEVEPLPDGTRRSDAGSRVVLSPSIWGVDPGRDTVSAGPFLVRWLSPDWEVAARYDPSRSVRVVIP